MGRQRANTQRGTATEMAAANRANTPRRELARLATHPDALISRLVAQRDDLTFDLQRVCASSADEPTRRAVAMGDGTEPSVLAWLATDRSPEVRAAVAANAATAPEVLTRLAGDNDWATAVAVVTNPNLDPALLPQLLAAAIRHDDDELIAAASAPWPDTVIDAVTILGAPGCDFGPRDVLEVALGLHA